jgi:hypothetical protein
MKFEYSNPFTAPGVWLMGNLHTHTTVSDGARTPQEAVDHYSQGGYDFLSLTDHGTLVDPNQLKSRGMVLIPGEEVCVGRSSSGTHYHIVAANIREILPIRDFDVNLDPQRVIDLIAELGGFAILAHPYWSGLHTQDLLRLGGYDGVEIYNTSCDVYRGLGYSGSHIDAMLAAGKRPLIFASDDHHGEPEPMKPSDACGGWIMVKARNKSLSSIVEAIRDGLFYSSTGPSLKNVDFGPGGIHVETSPVRSITFASTPSLGSRFTAPHDSLISNCTYPGRSGETYVRVEVKDERGGVAWSNAMYVG